MKNLNDTLPELMRRATENLEPESTDLVERGIRRGTTLRRRRTALLSVSGAAAVLATAGVVVGGTQLFGSAEDKQAPVAGTPSSLTAPLAAPATLKDTLATLQKLMPATLQVSKPTTWGGGEMDMNGASIVVNDGKGASLLTATAGYNVKKTCADAEPGTCTTRADGTVVIAYGLPAVGKSTSAAANAVEVYRPDGSEVTLMNFNAAEEKGSAITRPKPLFSLAALTQFADSKSWGFPVRHSVPTPTGEPAAIKAKPPIVPLAQTLATLRQVLPGNPQVATPTTWGGGNAGFNGAAYVTNDGKGASQVTVMLTTSIPVTKCAGEGLQHCKVRSDGTVLSWSASEPTYSDERQSINGVIGNSVQLYFPDGRQINLTSYNAPAEKNAQHTRTKPAYSVAQLTTMADSTLWKFPGGTTDKGSK
jgi:hypothetical protein